MLKQFLSSPGKKERIGHTSWKPYHPFPRTKGFLLAADKRSAAKILLSASPEYSLCIKPNGYLPKSGILLCKYLSRIARNKSVLDIGTGECGLLAIHAKKSGASYVVGIDIDPMAVKQARYNAKINDVRAKWLVSDTFHGNKTKFDIIISNLPQMPMRKGSLHDCGGRNGRRLIEKIIRQANDHLRDGGKLILLIFDFLGVDKTYGIQPTLLRLMQDKGFRTKIISRHQRIVTKGGKTEKSLFWIKKYYPQFHFQKNKSGLLTHRIFIVQAEKVTPQPNAKH